MQKKDNQYRIYIRSANLRVPCTKKQFDDYYRDINAFRRTQMNHGRCVCPPSKWLMCDMDCCTCPYRTSGDISYLDDSLADDEGNEMNWLDHLQEKMPDLQTPSLEDIAADGIEIQRLFARLCELMPQAIEIGRLREQGLSDTAIAGEIGIPRKTFTDRIKKAESILKAEFPEFF